MQRILRIGTRDSQLAVWQATLVQNLLKKSGVQSELVYIKSEGDIDLVTPLYEIGVQGVFTRSLDAALLNKRIDVAVHSMKDVPVQLAKGIQQAAVLKRASYKDVFVFKNAEAEKEYSTFNIQHSTFVVATSSIRRTAQWLNRFPNHKIENLRGNVNTRLKKLSESNWHGAIFAAAGLERIGLRPENSIELDWMLPAPAQGAIMIVCREGDEFAYQSCHQLNDNNTDICTKIERDFLKALLGGCSTPISALAEIKKDQLSFQGNILSPDGKKKANVSYSLPVEEANGLGKKAAGELLKNGSEGILREIKNAGSQD
ncbi:MAG: hydroxymethylbilane synthase [Chitinophagaceae bacterium]